MVLFQGVLTHEDKTIKPLFMVSLRSFSLLGADTDNKDSGTNTNWLKVKYTSEQTTEQTMRQKGADREQLQYKGG